MVRTATPGDKAAIRKVHLAAFPTELEADLVQRLERDGDAAISLVAEDAGVVIGHILFSRMQVRSDGRELEALGLAPVAVLPDRQGTGVGSALIEAGLSAARDRRADLVFVLGEPEFYGRFGFSAKCARPFASPYAGEYFLAHMLGNDIPAPASGRADYAPAFAELE